MKIINTGIVKTEGKRVRILLSFSSSIICTVLFSTTQSSVVFSIFFPNIKESC